MIERDINLETRILDMARTEPEMGQSAVAQKLQLEGIKASASGVRYIWKKHGLETRVKRLQALVWHDDGNGLSQNQQNLLDRGLRTRELQGTEESGQASEGGRREILLNTAAELFATHGFDRTSMRDIASRAGLLPGSIYHHFASKTELFLAIHQEGFNSVIKHVREAADQGSTPWDSLSQALGVHIQYMVGDAPPVQRLTGQSLAMKDHPELREQIRPYRDAYENLIRELIAPLPLRTDSDRTLLRLTLLGASNWVFVWYREDGKSPQEIAQAMVNMLRNGVGV